MTAKTYGIKLKGFSLPYFFFRTLMTFLLHFFFGYHYKYFNTTIFCTWIRFFIFLLLLSYKSCVYTPMILYHNNNRLALQ